MNKKFLKNLNYFKETDENIVFLFENSYNKIVDAFLKFSYNETKSDILPNSKIFDYHLLLPANTSKKMIIEISSLFESSATDI